MSAFSFLKTSQTFTRICWAASARYNAGHYLSPFGIGRRRWQSSNSRKDGRHETTFRRLELNTEPKRLSKSSSATEDAHIDRERFYDYYLTFKVRPGAFPPGKWLQDIAIDAAREALPMSLRVQPLDFFSGTSRDLSTAQKCLELYLSNEPKFSKEEIMAHCLRDRPGTQALAWLLRGYDQADLSDNVGFLQCLVHCIVAEGADSHIWRWLSVRDKPSVLSQQPPYDQNAWQASVLRCLVESQAYWSTGEGINASLRSFEHACLLCERNRDAFLEMVPAKLWIIGQLRDGGANAADVKLFDRFVWRMGIYDNYPASYAYTRAELLRVHPLRPSGMPGFLWLQREAAATPRSAFLRDLLRRWAGFFFLLRSAQRLDWEGHSAEARWTLDFGRAEMPRRFKMRAYSVPDPNVPLGWEARHPDKSQLVFDERSRRRRQQFGPRS